MPARRPLLWLLGVATALPLGCASDPAPRPVSAPEAKPTTTRYRVGDFVTYHYAGDDLEAPVVLHERIVSQ